MVPDDPLPVMHVRSIDRITLPPPASPRRDRPATCSDRPFLKALVIMVLKRLPTVYALLAVLDQPTREMRQRRQLLTEGGRFPARRTWEPWLAAVPTRLPDQIACLGAELVRLLAPRRERGRAVAIDRATLAVRGGVWLKKHRGAGVVPHTSIDTEAHRIKSDWRLGLRLEAASGGDRGGRLDSAPGGPHPCQHGRQRAGRRPLDRPAGGHPLRFGRQPLLGPGPA